MSGCLDVWMSGLGSSTMPATGGGSTVPATNRAVAVRWQRQSRAVAVRWQRMSRVVAVRWQRYVIRWQYGGSDVSRSGVAVRC